MLITPNSAGWSPLLQYHHIGRSNKEIGDLDFRTLSNSHNLSRSLIANQKARWRFQRLKNGATKKGSSLAPKNSLFVYQQKLGPLMTQSHFTSFFLRIS
jgi:hypothetical protein